MPPSVAKQSFLEFTVSQRWKTRRCAQVTIVLSWAPRAAIDRVRTMTFILNRNRGLSRAGSVEAFGVVARDQPFGARR